MSHRVVAALVVSALCLGAPRVDAQPHDAGVARDSGLHVRVIETGDAAWPRGALGQAIGWELPRPGGMAGVLRSVRAPVAVHVGRGVDVARAETVLRVAEQVCDRLESRLGMELPAPDGTRGGGAEFDLYLTADGPALAVVPEGAELSALWDRASAWAQLRADDPASLPRRVAEALGRAVVYGAKADHPPAAVAALGATLARRTLDLPSDPLAVSAFQSQPGRAVLGADRDEAAHRGAGLFFDWLHAQYDDPTGALLRGLIVGAAQRTPPGETTYWDEPDVLDVARRVLRDEPGGFPRVFLQFALARPTFGTAGDALALTGHQGPALVSPPARRLRWGALPSWQVVTGVEPTGSAVVRIDLADAPDLFTGDPSLSVYVHVPPWHRWVAAIQRYDALGRAVGVAPSEVITDGFWSARAEALEGVAVVDVVAVNLGGMDIDPDLPIPPRSFVAVHVVPGTAPPLPR
jgi:hypothetical protein